MTPHDVIQRVQDVDPATVGKIMVAGASGMTTLQVLTAFGSIVLIALNIILACLGIHLWRIKAKTARAELQAALRATGAPRG